MKIRKRVLTSEENKRRKEEQRMWEELNKKYPPLKKKKSEKCALVLPKETYREGSQDFKQAKSAGNNIGSTAKRIRVYTGDKIVGIGTMHKSNSVPVFSKDDAKDIARMRRN